MSFQAAAEVVLSHEADVLHPADLSFQVSGHTTQQLSVLLQPGNRLVGWANSVIAYDRVINFEDAGNKQLVMAHNAGQTAGRIVMSPRGPVGTFDLRQSAGRILLPQESFLAAGPGVRLRPYCHIKSLASEERPDGLVLLQAAGDGWVFTGASGEVSHTRLAAGETLAVRSCAIAAIGATIVIDVAAAPGEQRGGMALLRGPGRVWLQSSRYATIAADTPQIRQDRPAFRLMNGDDGVENPLLQ